MTAAEAFSMSARNSWRVLYRSDLTRVCTLEVSWSLVTLARFVRGLAAEVGKGHDKSCSSVSCLSTVSNHVIRMELDNNILKKEFYEAS